MLNMTDCVYLFTYRAPFDIIYIYIYIYIYILNVTVPSVCVYVYIEHPLYHRPALC